MLKSGICACALSMRYGFLGAAETQRGRWPMNERNRLQVGIIETLLSRATPFSGACAPGPWQALSRLIKAGRHIDSDWVAEQKWTSPALCHEAEQRR